MLEVNNCNKVDNIAVFITWDRYTLPIKYARLLYTTIYKPFHVRILFAIPKFERADCLLLSIKYAFSDSLLVMCVMATKRVHGWTHACLVLLTWSTVNKSRLL